MEAPKQKNNEWYTPSKYIEAARQVMGGIDLDPASCALANQTVKATRYYTKEDNGLSKTWKANSVWLNPPYGRLNAVVNSAKGFGNGGGKSLNAMFIAKLLQEYQEGHLEQAVLCMTSDTDASWFKPLWQFLICFADHRIEFNRPGMSPQGQFFGTCFTYLGPNEQRFIEVFSQFGRIAKAIDTPPEKPTMRELWEVSA